MDRNTSQDRNASFSLPFHTLTMNENALVRRQATHGPGAIGDPIRTAPIGPTAAGVTETTSQSGPLHRDPSEPHGLSAADTVTAMSSFPGPPNPYMMAQHLQILDQTARQQGLHNNHFSGSIQDHDGRISGLGNQIQDHNDTIAGHGISIRRNNADLQRINGVVSDMDRRLTSSSTINHHTTLGEHVSAVSGHVSQLNESLTTLTRHVEQVGLQEQAQSDQFKEELAKTNRSLELLMGRTTELEDKVAQLRQTNSRLHALEAAVAGLQHIASPSPLGFGRPQGASRRHVRITQPVFVEPGTTPSHSGVNAPGNPFVATPQPRANQNERARFPQQTITTIADNLFRTVERWSQNYAIVPLSSLASNEENNAAVVAAADEAAGESRGRALLESPDRYYLVSGLVSRLLLDLLINRNIAKGWDTTSGAQYTAMYDHGVAYWTREEGDYQGRGVLCKNLADLAQKVSQNARYWDFASGLINKTTEQILELLAPLIPLEYQLNARTALRQIAETALRLAVRLAVENHEYEIRFAKFGDRFNSDTMVVRNINITPEQALAQRQVVRLSIAPTVIEKTFSEILNAECLFRGPMLVMAREEARV